MAKASIVIGGVLLLVVVYSALLYFSATSAQISIANISPHVTDIANAILSRRLDVDVYLTVRGQGPLSVPVKSLSFSVYLEGIYVGKIVNDEGFTIPSGGGATEAHVVVTIDLAGIGINEVMTIVDSIRSHNGEVAIRLDGYADVVFLIFTITVPISKSQYLLITSPSPIVHATWDKTSVASGEASRFQVTLTNVYRGTTISGSLRVEVREDIAFASDRSAAFYDFTVDLAPSSSATYGNSFTAYEGTNLRGFFIKVYWGGQTIYEMSSDYPPRLKLKVGSPRIFDAYWIVGSQRSSSAMIGDPVEADILVKAEGGPVSGTFLVKIRKDITLAPDEDYDQSSFTVSIREDESVRLYFTWAPDEASGGFLRGYHLEVLFNGKSIWTMDETYPPRLTVSKATPTQGSLEIVSVYWAAGGQQVTSVEVSRTVEAHVVCTAQGGPITGPLLIKVKKDISYAPDTEYTEQTFQVNLDSGVSNDLYFPWVPDEPSVGSLRGYFLEIWFNGVKVQTMSSSYPPRLKATITSQGFPEIIDAYWMIGSTRVTTAKVNDRVEAHVTIRATNGPLDGYITIRIRKDIILLPDTDYKVQIFQISVRSGEETDVSLTFYPDESSGGALRGYFIEVNLTTWSKEWTMDSSFPPRLNVL